MSEEKFPNTRKPSQWQACGEFWDLREQHNREGKKKTPQNMHLTTTPSAELAQTLIRHQQAGAGQGGTGCIA